MLDHEFNLTKKTLNIRTPCISMAIQTVCTLAARATHCGGELIIILFYMMMIFSLIYAVQMLTSIDLYCINFIKSVNNAYKQNQIKCIHLVFGRPTQGAIASSARHFLIFLFAYPKTVDLV